MKNINEGDFLINGRSPSPEELHKMDRVVELSRKRVAYNLVFYTRISPRELDEDLVIKLDVPEPKTQEEKREVKLAELDAYKAKSMKAYKELCDSGVVEYDFRYLMENGFTLGAGDLLDDKAIDDLIAKDEQI